MRSEDMTNCTELQEEAHTKAAENRREDKKALKKLLLVIGLAGVAGFFVGIFSVFAEEGVFAVTEAIKSAVCVAAPFGNLVFGTLAWIVCAGLMRQSRRMYDTWDGEDEDVIDRVELKLSYAISLTSIHMIVSFFLYGLGMYSMEFRQMNRVSEMIKIGMVFGGFIYAMFVNVILQKNLVNFTKEINPEKQGSVYDLKFQKTWMESCDESEKLQTYQAGFAAMRTCNYTCIGLFIISLIGMLTWNFGIMPMIMVFVIWMVSVVRYNVECIRLSKKSGGNKCR